MNRDNTNTPSENVGTKLLFENERIRVWDLALQPGESLATHVHTLPFCFIVAQGGHLRHQNPNDPSDSREVNYEQNLVVFHDPAERNEPTIHQELTNIGDAPYRNYVIEFKDAGGHAS
jgi:hypothetical protein